jgi:FkbM family methyltransferase
MNPVKIFLRPEYLFRPKQIIHRLKRLYSTPKKNGETVILPWGDPIKVSPNEVIGAGIWCYGVFDLIVGEAIVRLLDKGETAFDIGANIGQFSTLMARRVGLGGKVLSFEPHPGIYQELITNCDAAINCKKILKSNNSALGQYKGEGTLAISTQFEENRGTSRIETGKSNGEKSFVVKIETLDDQCQALGAVGVCKIDVEGHETEVFKGGAKTLQQKKIRDIIYEDVERSNTELQSILLRAGYTIFSLHTDVLRPRISPFDSKRSFKTGQEGENFLATLDPGRAIHRFQRFGWEALKKQPNNI